MFSQAQVGHGQNCNVEHGVEEGGTAMALNTPKRKSSPQLCREVAFIDPAIADASHIAAGLHAAVEPVLLKDAGAPFAQIADWLTRNGQVAAIHIFAHGAPGAIAFSAGTVTNDGLAESSSHLDTIGKMLGEGSSLQVWSCETADGEAGATFIQSLSDATGRPVAAASGKIGAVNLGGNWNLDRSIGHAAVTAPLTAQAMASYTGVLQNNNATTSVDNITQSVGADTLTVTATTQIQATDLFDGAAGTDAILISGSAGVTVDISAAGITTGVGLRNLEALNFDNSSGTSTLTVSAAQFGSGLIATALAVTGAAGTQLITVNNATNFSLSAWTFTTWTSGTDKVTINGSTGADTITGSANIDTINGGTGADTITGGAGADSLTGGTGADVFVISVTSDLAAGETIAGTVEAATLDTIRLDAAGTYSLSAFTTITNIDQIIFNQNSAGFALTVVDSQVSTADADGNGTLGDMLINSAVAMTNGVTIAASALTGVNRITVDGTNLGGNDTITGGAGADVAAGGAGADSITGGAGADSITGGAGADVLTGGTGADVIIISASTDLVAGETINGTSESTTQDTLRIDAAAAYDLSAFTTITNLDRISLNQNAAGFGLTLVDSQVSTADADGNGTQGDTTIASAIAMTNGITVTASALTGTNRITVDGTNLGGNDTLSGGAGADTIDGGAGSDSVSGAAGVDVLSGSAGADTITGGAGADSTTGGTGADVFVIASSTDLAAGETINGTVEAATLDTIRFDAAATYSLSAFTTITNIDQITFNQNSAGFVATVVDSQVSTADGNLDGTLGDMQFNSAVAMTSGVTITASALTGVNRVTVDGTNLGGNDTITGGAGADAVVGGAGADSVTGGAGADTITGGASADILTGGTGADVFVITDSANLVAGETVNGTSEAATQDTLRIDAAAAYDLSAFTTITNLDRISLNQNAAGFGLTLVDSQVSTADADGNGTQGDMTIASAVAMTNGISVTASALTGSNRVTVDGTNLGGNDTLAGGAGADTLGGGAGADSLTGGAGNDSLSGGTGADSMTGGTGNDNYVIDNAGDAITENASEGSDLVQSSVTYTLGLSVEDLTLTGSAAINATGNGQVNTLTGNSGDNTLDGGAAGDSMVGGAGNDSYVVAQATDTVTENASEGTDNIQASVTYTISANVENMTLTGIAAINGTGNTGANILTGNTADNTLDGGAGNDTMAGGAGNDTYAVDSSTDVVTELASEGTDTVQAAVTYTLGNNIENLTLTGSSAINGTGNTSANSITGNGADNVLNGGTGADSMAGGLGNDTYIVDDVGDVLTEAASAGTDTVQAAATFTLAANFENLTLTGTAAINGTGNTAANVLTGNNGNNVLDGGTGADTMAGGIGNDTYVVDNVGDVVTEFSGEGTDTIQTAATFTIGANIENLTLSGSSAINGTGNTLDNLLTGNTAANTLSGSDGNDTLDGGAGNDTMVGGIGNDTYVVDSASDVVTELSGEGSDTVQTSFSFVISNNIENLTLTGSAAINGMGSTDNNVIIGNSGDNIIDGAAGADSMTGGAGNDTFIVDNAGDIVSEAASGGTDNVQSSVSFALGGNIETLVLTGSANINGTGNSSANALTGNTGNNILDGGSGIDSMTGGAGNDTYLVDNAGDVVVELAGGGNDTIETLFSFTIANNIENLVLLGTGNINGYGDAQANNLTGNTGDNILDGAGGADTMAGGLGNDTYVVDDAGDVVTELADEGTDTVTSASTFTLSGSIENLTLTGALAVDGTGSTADNYLTGNSAANMLSGLDGNDTMDGGAGIDTMIGGIGDDTYVVDSVNDIITEVSGEGTDTISAAFTYTLLSDFENLNLTGSTAINGTGNSSNNVLTGNSAANYLTGLGGADTLNGGLGNDTMAGGAAADTYIVNAIGDVIIELANEGNDTVLSSITYTLGTDLEDLTLTGTSAINGTGNELENHIFGNTGANIINGGTGADRLFGGAGSDTYIVDNVDDVIVETANNGTDLVQSSVTYTLANNVEKLTLTGTSAIDGTGNSAINNMLGNSAANVLDGAGGNDNINGGSGADTMIGGTGSDTFVVDDSADITIEFADEGTDTVESSVDFTLQAYVEKLTLTGAAGITGTGNDDANTILGNGADNTIYGMGGDDSLNGSTGNDTMYGGLGDDSYTIGAAGDFVVEDAGEGIDTVFSAGTYMLLDNFENLTISGITKWNGTGNELNNILTGNTAANLLTSLDGDDTIDGGRGADTLVGGMGNDTYIVDIATDVVTELFDQGTDLVKSSVSYTLSTTLEDLTLTGNLKINGTGNNADNVITGNGSANTMTGLGGNDYLDGGAGSDTMVGGSGNDTYVVASSGDVVTEVASMGTDTVRSSITYTLSANLENLTLTGTSNINGTGNASVNVLIGNSGNNILDGGALGDSMTGGDGNDTYTVDNAADTVTELSGEGTDKVQASITYTLGSNVENLTLTGSAAINGTGNELDNTMAGNTGVNILIGGAGIDDIYGDAGNDTITGGAGADIMAGGGGNDTFVFSTITDSGTTVLADRDLIWDFSTGDIFDLSAIDANTSLANNQAFVIDTNGTLAAGEIMLDSSNGLDTIVSLETNGDGIADMVFTVQFTVGLTNTDFIL